MLDTPTSDNYRDFGARYSNTYGWLLRPSRPKRFVKLLDCDEDELRFRTSETGTVYNAAVDSGVEFEFQQVEKGLYQVKDNIYYLARVPARQWKRGICRANTDVQMLTEFGFKDVEVKDYDLFNAIFSAPINHLYQPEVALGRSPILLSKHFCLSPPGVVYFYNISIGVWDKTGAITLTVGYETVSQELSDVLRRNKWEVLLSIKEQ